MNNIRPTLITGVTDNPSYRNNDRIPTSYAVNQLFSGENLAENTDLNNVIKCGNYRFKKNCNHLPSHMTNNTNGILTVMHERFADPNSNSEFPSNQAITYSASIIRQIVWPDGPGDVTPYTRTKVDGVWGEWQTMGGGLRRVQMTTDIGEYDVLPNVMYYCFTPGLKLHLPNPKLAKFSFGTKVGLEQYAANGRVTAPNLRNSDDPISTDTAPTYEMDNTGHATNNYIGPTVYVFEVVADDQGNPQWLLDVDNNNGAHLQGLEERLALEAEYRLIGDNNEKTLREDADKVLQDNIDKSVATFNDDITQEREDRINADIELQRQISLQRPDRIYQISSNVNPDDILFTNVYRKNLQISLRTLLHQANMHATVTLNNLTITLPRAIDYPQGAQFSLELVGTINTIVKIEDNVSGISATETFTNTNATANLILPFEVVIERGNYVWNVVALK